METYNRTPGATGGTGELAQNPDPRQTKAAGGESAASKGQGNNQQGHFTPKRPTDAPLPDPADGPFVARVEVYLTQGEHACLCAIAQRAGVQPSATAGTLLVRELRRQFAAQAAIKEGAR
ncbi:hypothetical protein [uncultured Thiodictyon sp.]|uniref:hypothetical protein n=1 Tax=uncultured Thiodictyon sp. TaxID=1846217 RepID=UPI0025F35F83|nr:hypothetical protein [uncultured Thiodictyon sp.]